MRDNHSKDSDKFYKHDDPPNSRLFVAHTKQVSEDELREAFGEYGTIDDVWICREKNSGEPKDIAFIKFSKTSDAARAMEGLNGKVLKGHSRPLKVTVALSRDQPNFGGKGDDMERLLRLFVVVPKSMTENDIIKEFKEFGDIDYVSVVKDRETKESKGYAFVKFTRVSHAATAFEECDRSFKAVFARPKEQDQQRKSANTMDMYDRPNQSGNYSSAQSAPAPYIDLASFNRSYAGRDSMNMYASGSSKSDTAILYGEVSPELSWDQLKRLFDLMPGFVSCNCHRPMWNEPPLLMEVQVEYDSPAAANHALNKLNGFEYPVGKKIFLRPSYDHRNDGALSGKRDSMGLPTAPEITQELATLTKALAEATNMIKLQVGGLANASRMNNSQASNSFDPTFCTARLPQPQKLARRDSKMEERLFILGQPALPPQGALWDVFGRFGDLIEVYIINGKNCGFVNYAKKEAADQALETLNGQEVCKMRLKITFADPPKSDSRKRIKMDTDG